VPPLPPVIPPIFPLQPDTYPAFAVKRKPTFSTIVRTGKQGREIESAQQTSSLWEFELTYEMLRDLGENIDRHEMHHGIYVELQNLLGLYLSCAGQYGEFFFNDWTDNSREEQPLGTGDGTTIVFDFVRSIVGDLGLTVTETVGGVNIEDASVLVYLDGTPIPDTEWSISEDLTQLVFNSPPADGVAVTSSFYYYYRCRWISDYQEVEEFVYRYWSASSVKFRATTQDPYVEPVAIEPVEPPNPPTPPVTNCLKLFQWFNHTDPTAQAGQMSIDKFSNMWVWGVDVINPFHGKTYVYDSSGVELAGYTQTDLADGVDSWFGSSIVNRYHPEKMDVIGFLAQPIMQGNYVLAYLSQALSPDGRTFAKWFVVIDPDVGGGLNVVGACYVANGTGPPYTYANILDVANGQSTGDPILVLANAFIGAYTGVLLVLPSIDDMAGIGVGINPCEVPTTMFYPIGNADFSDHLFVFQSGNRSKRAGFILPNDSGETILYFYINRRYMDVCGSSSYTIADKEVKDVLQPTYPFGCMVKINLGEVDWATLSTTPLFSGYFGDATPGYSVDNANWQTSGSFAVVPMPDEYHYISNGALGGGGANALTTAAIYQTPGGKFWLPFYMAGIDDARNNQLGLIWDALRLFEWDPATEIATLLVYDNCVLHTMNNVNITGGGTPFWYWDDKQVMTFTDVSGTITISVRGLIYDTLFYQFTYP